MKRMLAALLCATLLLAVFPFSASANGPGDGNMDGGGGGMGEGSKTSFWNPGNDGCRVTVVDAENGAPVTTPLDFSNKSQPSTLVYFGKVCKVQYRNGVTLSPQSGGAYTCQKPANAMPTIISTSGRNNIEAIKRYWCSEYAVKMVSDATGFNYEKLIGGEYKLLVEPLAYYKFDGVMYCTTATEAALFDQKNSGSLRSKMGSMSHQNLPLAIFLETSELGFSAWSGAKSGRQANSDIINYLGIGIVRFKELPEGDLEAPDVEYRVDTDVITAVTLHTSHDLTPDNPASVTFRILGRSYRVNNVVIPGGDSQVVWVKWHTPMEPQEVIIDVSVSGAYAAQDTLVAKIVDLDDNIPPDPQATDTNPRYTVPALPSNPQKTTANWGVWSCYWVPVWEWCDHDDWGHWVDNGYWEFEYTGYSASLTGSMKLLPDDTVPTAEGKHMKSGYGVKTEVTAVLSTDAPSSHYTYTQTALATFPEFGYETYSRLLQRTSGGRSVKFSFKPNEFSTYNRAVHFSPVWFPDGTEYTIYTQVWDTWTPDGMLSVNVNDAVSIDGSLFDDWYTSRE